MHGCGDLRVVCALRCAGRKRGHLRVAYLYWRVDWCREVETHKIKEYWERRCFFEVVENGLEGVVGLWMC